MTVERICTRPGAGAAQQEHAQVRVVAGAGIEGDRYVGGRRQRGVELCELCLGLGAAPPHAEA